MNCNNFDLFGIISVPLGWLMWLCHTILPVYALALLLFTVLTRVMLFPLSLKQHKSTAKMMVLRPQLEEIQKKYANNKQKMQEEQMKVYEQAGSNPLSGCLPTILQLVVLFGLISVIYNPLLHVLQFSPTTIDALEAKATTVAEAVGETYNPAYDMYVISYYGRADEAVAAGKLEANPFTQYDETVTKEVVDKLGNFDMGLFGMFLGDVPQFPWAVVEKTEILDAEGKPVIDEATGEAKTEDVTAGWSWLLLLPLLSGATSFLTGWGSMKLNPMQSAAGGSMKTMMYIMPLFSIWIGFSVPAGVVLYWIYSNLTMFGQSYLLYKKFNPEKYVAEMKQKQLETKKKKPVVVSVPVETVDGETVTETRSMSQKELDRQRLAEARKRDAEKYGETYVDVTDDDLR